MMTRFSRSLFVLALAWSFACLNGPELRAAEEGKAQPVALQPHDRVVFLGDSITQQGAKPGGYVTLVRDALAKNEQTKSVEVIGAGISGNKVPDLEKRLERDVLSKKPSIVVIYIGINDVWHWNRNRGTKKEDFQSGLERIISQIQQAGAKVILCTPSTIGEKPDGSNEFDKMLEEYSAISRKIAEEKHIPLLDLRKAFISHLKEHNKDNAAKGVLTGDGVHLNAAGNQFVAAKMLAALEGKPMTEENSGKKLRHVVLFKFKKDVTKDQIQEVVDAFAALPKQIKAIEDFEWGTDVSVENKAAGFTHGFIVTFADEKGRDAYLPHPAHKNSANSSVPVWRVCWSSTSGRRSKVTRQPIAREQAGIIRHQRIEHNVRTSAGFQVGPHFVGFREHPPVPSQPRPSQRLAKLVGVLFKRSGENGI